MCTCSHIEQQTQSTTSFRFQTAGCLRLILRMNHDFHLISDLSMVLFPLNREYWMIYREPGFLAVVWFSSSPTPSPPLVSKLDRRHTERLRNKRQLFDRRGGKGVGEEPNNTTARKPGPLGIIQYSLPLWLENVIQPLINKELERIFECIMDLAQV